MTIQTEPVRAGTAPPDPAATGEDLAAVLPAVVAAVRVAGEELLRRFTPDPRPADGDQIVGAIHANDAASVAALRGPLLAARPGAGWVDDELEDGALPAGEWWVVDPVEGNINHVHGLPDWAVTATLVRDNQPVLTAVHLPLSGTTYTAVAGAGAHQDGVALRVSDKRALSTALVGTGQARPGESRQTYESIGRSVTAMLTAGLVTRVSVPATLQLIHVAAGRMDLFWQHSAVRSGLLAGALLVSESGGTVTDIAGAPWTLASTDFLAAAPSLHAAAVAVLSATPSHP